MTRNRYCGPADKRLALLIFDGSVLESQRAGVQARHQDLQAILLRQLKTGSGVIARCLAVAFVYWILRLQVQDHVL